MRNRHGDFLCPEIPSNGLISLKDVARAATNRLERTYIPKPLRHTTRTAGRPRARTEYQLRGAALQNERSGCTPNLESKGFPRGGA
jgi:hypothetical protein